MSNVECQRTPYSKKAQYLDIALFVSSKERHDIQATIECRVTLKHVYDMIKTHSQMHHTDKYSQHTSIICRPVWPSGWMFVYDLNVCRSKSCCSYLYLSMTAVIKFKVNIKNYRNKRVIITEKLNVWTSGHII